MNFLHKTTSKLFFLLFMACSLSGFSQQIVSYAYDNAGNRISRKVINLTVTPNPAHAKKGADPAPVVEQLGERKITVFPNPTKGSLAVEIVGGDEKDELSISLYTATGQRLLSKSVQAGTTPINMTPTPKHIMC
jgi:hypothetical protein